MIRRALEKDLYSRYKNGADFAKDLSAVAVQDTRRQFGAGGSRSLFHIAPDALLHGVRGRGRSGEILRISRWRKVDANTLLIREGDSDQRFGIIVEGRVEMSVDGHRVCELAYGEVFGELAFLDQQEHRHSCTAVATTGTVYTLESTSALSLATDECQDAFRSRLVTIVARRLGQAYQELAKDGPPAERITVSGFGMELQVRRQLSVRRARQAPSCQMNIVPTARYLYCSWRQTAGPAPCPDGSVPALGCCGWRIVPRSLQALQY